MNNQAILEELNYYVVGHLEAKKALITLLTRSRLRHYQKYMKDMEEEFLLSPIKLLLLGASGSGKTHLMESLQKVVHFPLVRLDATHLVPTGGGGGVKPHDLKNKIVEEAVDCCKQFPARYFSVEGAIDKTVVFIDEIDKLGRNFDSTSSWNKHVQSNFLTLFDNKAEFSGISFVFAGAFNEITSKKDPIKSIGFNKQVYDKEEICLDEEIVKNGLIPELVGRLTHIIELDRFDKEMYLYILKEKLIPKKTIDMAAFGVFDLEIPLEKLEEIASKAEKSNQGVRYLHRALDRYFLDAEFKAGLDYTTYNDH